MAKVLNLDKLAKVPRELVMGGKTHAVNEMTVETFIESSRIAEELEGEKSFAKQMEASVRLIKMSVPTVTEADLKGLSMEQLAAVSRFVRGEDITEEPEGQEGEAGKA